MEASVNLSFFNSNVSIIKNLDLENTALNSIGRLSMKLQYPELHYESNKLTTDVDWRAMVTLATVSALELVGRPPASSPPSSSSSESPSAT
jgi:hypothetical protein